MSTNRGRAPITSGRYVPVIVNGHRQWARDQVALQAEIVSLLELGGGIPKKRIITALATAHAAVETALNTLLDARKIERYRAMSARRRMDEHWCLFGQAPRRPVRAGFSAAAILAAMQNHATLNHGVFK